MYFVLGKEANSGMLLTATEEHNQESDMEMEPEPRQNKLNSLS